MSKVKRCDRFLTTYEVPLNMDHEKMIKLQNKFYTYYSCMQDSNISVDKRKKNKKDSWKLSILQILHSKFFRSMAKGKQTATKSTGGEAARKNLVLKAVHQTKALVGQKYMPQNCYRPRTVVLREICRNP